MMFGKQKRIIEVNGKSVELEPKPSLLSGVFKKRPASSGAPRADQQPRGPRAMAAPAPPHTAAPAAAKPEPAKPSRPSMQPLKGQGALYMYVERTASKHKNLEASLREQGIRQGVHEFVQRMMIASAMLAVVIALTLFFTFLDAGLPLAECVMFGFVLGIVTYYVAFGEFINFPARHARVASKNIERDILFAARDMIISLRSGMPLFNAITAISTGYGDASEEFAKVVERVQLGLPLEEAIDQTAAETKSPSFRRIMLQASMSIKAGADVVGALQSVIDQLSQERVIELRRYGQRLNAIAMFYMLFGIILPSMGIAVITILTTFIAIFTVTNSVLAFVIVGMVFLQIVFLQLIRGSRPVYTM